MRHIRLLAPIYLHVTAFCLTLFIASQLYPDYHIAFRRDQLPFALAAVAAFLPVAAVFAISEFSFGYFIGFYFYSMIAGYLWLNSFSEFQYDHRLAGISAYASAVAFLLPAVLLKAPLRQLWTPSRVAFDRLLDAILLGGGATLLAAAAYHFDLAQLLKLIRLDGDIYVSRDAFKFPKLLNYLLGITASALLPFAFACFAERRMIMRAATTLGLLLLFYPVTLSKFALFSAAWISLIALAARLMEARLLVIVSLLAPTVIGILMIILWKFGVLQTSVAHPYFALINLRMMTFPSLAMDYYNEFFSKNDLTLFCQISVLKTLAACPYREQLGIVIYKAFGIGGYFNASLFATEGIASVGNWWAPTTAFAGGLVVALGNRISAGLPPRFVLMSAALLPQVFLNVPLTVVLVTHGFLVLLVLWYITPRAA
ncbi:hypothetical protein JEY40_30075 [Bradyrhizobium japonicum]|uniref:Oligosaccharide repeat unit polymerase n=1 Tax=Bradyrhizobium japonicum TaxID=375 RepID=A0ABV2RST8_BRAJP|nr:hypothetical protein [Bradyrhizobium japonicum]UQD70206.1 hypothetical protein JEY40_30075 [Bradyrhizobium japonicum]WLB16834.1 hypothetical protein QIH95_33070 [Bradyrhizobium japonicum]